jgi:peptidoglycan/LPS O-acetylase OafA/YrhL
MDQDGIAFGWLPLTHLSHEAVIVFFVLSGFIIHHSTTNRLTTASAYAAARLSRMYSVVLPAIILCSALALLVEYSGFKGTMTNYKEFAWSHAISSALFLNESWNNPATLSLNAPFWSLCYEVWFYVMFGVFVFARGAARWGLLALAALIAGPAILALLPVWLMGAWLSARGFWATLGARQPHGLGSCCHWWSSA